MKPVNPSSTISGTAPVESDNRCAAGHSLDHYQAERLGPVDRHQQCNCATEKRGFLFVRDRKPAAPGDADGAVDPFFHPF
jgi:hypothetical protein